MASVITPIVKCKCGDLGDTNNYRAITLSNAVTKILESVILDHISELSIDTNNQFGFKHGHSTSLCTNTLRQVVDYYRNWGSHVFVCFADFSKAFDQVNYIKLLKKLLSDGIYSWIVSILLLWYSHLQVSVLWNRVLSSPFCISNGTRQGGILSPTLFNRYVRDMIVSLLTSRVGCNVGGSLRQYTCVCGWHGHLGTVMACFAGFN